MGQPAAGRRLERLSSRTRAWLWAACAAALVLGYLVVWTVYSMAHLPDYARYEQLPAGASATGSGVDFRLVGLVQTHQLSVTLGTPQDASANAVWVVATLEVVPRTATAQPDCSFELVGPDQRAWRESPVVASRAAPSYCLKANLRQGRPFRFENVFEVPARYADGLYGVALVRSPAGQPRQVLRPA